MVRSHVFVGSHFQRSVVVLVDDVVSGIFGVTGDIVLACVGRRGVDVGVTVCLCRRWFLCNVQAQGDDLPNSL